MKGVTELLGCTGLGGVAELSGDPELGGDPELRWRSGVWRSRVTVYGVGFRMWLKLS